MTGGNKSSVGQQGDVVVGGERVVRLLPGTVEIDPVFRHTTEITDRLYGREANINLLSTDALFSAQERNG